MLAFFRKHQKVFFIFITIIIVISFSFFGTYASTASSSKKKKTETAFIAINGKKISRTTLRNLHNFIATDREDKKLQPNNWNTNFLNDGVIRRDFLKTGLAKILYQSYRDNFQEDIIAQHKREKQFKPYTHPQASFLSANSVWSQAAPSIRQNLNKLQRAINPTTDESFDTRIALFLAEKKFSPQMLQQYLLYQLRLYNWIPQDPNMQLQRLTLFGYATIDDWFGQNFTETIAEFIINAAIIAGKNGYKVSKEEALANLLYNSQKSLEEQNLNPQFGLKSNTIYFQYQLQAMHIDQAEAIEAWRYVMLFRRLFHDVGGFVAENDLPYEQFNAYANKTLTVDSYNLPKELQLSNDKDLYNFETYLRTIKQSAKKQDLLSIKTKFHDLKYIKKNYPELVQKRYLLKVNSTTTALLHTKIGLKETWNWQLDKENWATLVKEFPELATDSDDRDEHFAALEKRDDNSRAKIDAFAREKIIEKHPEWIEQALQEDTPQEKTIAITYQGTLEPLPGITDSVALMQLLDKTKTIENFTQDQKHFYNIEVLDSTTDEIMTFQEAKQSSILKKLLNKNLKAFYNKSKKKFDNQKQLQDSKGGYKPFEDVRTLVAEEYFKPVKAAIAKDFTAHSSSTIDEKRSPNFYATHRLYSYVKNMKTAIVNSPSTKELFINESMLDQDSFTVRADIDSQWKLVKKKKEVKRNSGYFASQKGIFEMPAKEWSAIIEQANGEIAFFQITNISVPDDALPTMVNKAHKQLSIAARRILMKDLLRQIKAKGAIIPTLQTPTKEDNDQ